MIFRLWRRVVWCAYSSVLVRNYVTIFRVAVRTITIRSNYTGWRTADCHISILVCRKYQSAVRHSVYRGCRKGGHSDPPSSLRPCRWRQHISPKRRYPRAALHGVTKQQQYTVNKSSFCCSLSRVPERTATACEPVYPWRRGGGTGGLPAHGE